MTLDRASIIQVLVENGFDNSGENPHSWRCKWYAETADPEKGREPICTCPQDIADAILKLEES